MDTNILLESGTNELEVLEFTLGNNHYGINVAKIREILTYQPITPVPNSHPSVEGIFMPRDTMITVVNLKRCLGMAETGDGEGLFIITNFNKLNIAFHVDAVIGIHRVSWESIIKPDSTINTEENSASTGVIKLDNKLIIILDFEKIVTDISPETGLKVSDMENMPSRERCDSPILDRRGLATAQQADHRLSEKSRIYQPDCYHEWAGSMGQVKRIEKSRKCV